MKKELAIVFGITGNWAFALANTLIGLKKYSPELLKTNDVIVYYDNLSIKNKLALRKITDINFIKSNFPYKKESKKINNLDIFKEISFCRYECFNLLKKYRTILWLDVDILIQKDISGIFKIKESFAMLDSQGNTLGKTLTQEINDYETAKAGYGTGTILFRDSLNNYERMAEWCYKKTIEYGPYLVCPDQVIMNFLLQEFQIDFGIIGKEYVHNPTEEGWQDAKILHAYGQKKFWTGVNNDEWNRNNIKWIKLGGAEYDSSWDYSNIPSLKRRPVKFVKNFIKRYIT